jgi:hypothetical protein
MKIFSRLSLYLKIASGWCLFAPLFVLNHRKMKYGTFKNIIYELGCVRLWGNIRVQIPFPNPVIAGSCYCLANTTREEWREAISKLKDLHINKETFCLTDPGNRNYADDYDDYGDEEEDEHIYATRMKERMDNFLYQIRSLLKEIGFNDEDINKYFVFTPRQDEGIVVWLTELGQNKFLPASHEASAKENDEVHVAVESSIEKVDSQGTKRHRGDRGDRCDRGDRGDRDEASIVDELAIIN